MKLGFSLPMAGAWATPDNQVLVAQRAEALGYHSLWVFQRLLYAVKPQNDYPPLPGQPWPKAFERVMDPLVSLAFVAGVTRRIRLGTSVLIMPYYTPVMLAKQLATLDVVSRGRLDVGLGLGWSMDEFDAGPPVVEDLPKLAVDEEPVHENAQRPEGRRVAHLVLDDRAVVFRPEAMAVIPEAVHAGDLHVAEAMRRIVLADEGAPVRPHAQDPHVIVERESPRHDDRPLREDAEAEPGRRDARQVARLREEREGRGQRTRHPLSPVQRGNGPPDHAP
jgi:hypothetical protein